MIQETRKVSFPVGETSFVERVTRITYADGTVMESPPYRVVDPDPSKGIFGVRLAAAARGIAEASASFQGVTVCRLHRRVTVVASEWEEEHPPLGDFVAAQYIPAGSLAGTLTDSEEVRPLLFADAGFGNLGTAETDLSPGDRLTLGTKDGSDVMLWRQAGQ